MSNQPTYAEMKSDYVADFKAKQAETLHNPPAFPGANPNYDGNWDNRQTLGGMSLRDYFAAHAPAMPENFTMLPGKYVTEVVSDEQGNLREQLVWTATENEMQRLSRWRWHYADAMLAARTAKPDDTCN